MQATATSASPAALARDMLAVVGDLIRASTPDFFRVLSDHELSLTQMKMLHQLDWPEREMPLTELAETLSLSLPAVSRAIDALQQLGYVERREDDHDRRVKRVRITSAGRRVLKRLMEARLHMLERVTATLTEEERAALIAALAPLVERVAR